MSPETLNSLPSDSSGRRRDRANRSVARTVPNAARPPSTNRGVYPPSDPQKSAISASDTVHRFDYYRATPKAEYSELLTVFEYELGQVYGDVRKVDGPPTRHYAMNTALVDRFDNVLVEILAGGANGRPNVLARGSSSEHVAGILRANWEHSPSRLDACMDVVAPGLWSDLVFWTKAFASEHGIGRKFYEDDDPDHGETIYLGSRSSASFLRIYQPGLKRAQDDGRTGDQIHQDERDTIRFELEYKPNNRSAKRKVSSLHPSAIWSLSPWTCAFADRIMGLRLKPVSVAMRRESNMDRALRHMCGQYRNHLEALLHHHQGDFEAVAVDLLERSGIISGV